MIKGGHNKLKPELGLVVGKCLPFAGIIIGEGRVMPMDG